MNKKMKQKEKLKIENMPGNTIITIIFIVLIVFMVSSLVISNFRDVPATCSEYGIVNFRYLGVGGLMGGIQKVPTNGTNYDGTMAICLKGKNVFGEDWPRK
jgi:putative component of membrane protein insertase Oxa1/YidC/SpoIIIJ protein YidD